MGIVVAIPAIWIGNARVIMAAPAKFFAVGVACGDAGAGGILVVSLPIKCDELPLPIAHRLVPPIFQQPHVRAAHVASGRDALLFLAGSLIGGAVRAVFSVESAVPDGGGDQSDEKSQAREN